VGKKHGKSFYGYKNHIAMDVLHKLIRCYAVTDAALHDSKVFGQLFPENTSKDIWADSAERVEHLSKDGFREHLHRNHPLT
jgi:Transposase DDE domain.